MLEEEAIAARVLATGVPGPWCLAAGDRDMAAVVALLPDRRPQVLWDGHLAVAAHPGLQAALARHAEVWPGGLDGYTGDRRWRFGWTTAPGPFRLFNRQRLLASLDDGWLTLRNGRRIAATDILEVRRELSADWAHRGVTVRLCTGEDVPVLLRYEWTLGFWMFYDGLELLCDTGWVHAIGRALSGALDVPCPASPHFD